MLFINPTADRLKNHHVQASEHTLLTASELRSDVQPCKQKTIRWNILKYVDPIFLGHIAPLTMPIYLIIEHNHLVRCFTHQIWWCPQQTLSNIDSIAFYPQWMSSLYCTKSSLHPDSIWILNTFHLAEFSWLNSCSKATMWGWFLLQSPIVGTWSNSDLGRHVIPPIVSSQ